MSRKRCISTEISTDSRLAELAEHGAMALLLYTWAIPHADDWGRLTGDARQFKLLVCPALDVTAKEVEEALSQIAACGLWERYESEGGKKCIAFPYGAWIKHQSYINAAKRGEDKSHFPPPPGFCLPETAPNAEESQASPNNSANHRKTPQNSASPSPSPTPSITNGSITNTGTDAAVSSVRSDRSLGVEAKDPWEPDNLPAPPAPRKGKDYEGYIARMEAKRPEAMPFVDHEVATKAKTSPVPFRASVWRRIETGETPESVWRSFVPPPPARIPADTPDDPAHPTDANGSIIAIAGGRCAVSQGMTNRPARGWACEDGWYYPSAYPEVERIPLPETNWAGKRRAMREAAASAAASASVAAAAGMPA